jgi:hypothetical protein
MKFSYPSVSYVSPNKRYDFKVMWDQFGRLVPEDFYDITELTLIKKFEDTVLKLAEEDSVNFSMIELGSNQAYYTLLFRCILRSLNKYSFCVCIEPNRAHSLRGQQHLENNGFVTYFKDWIVGDYETIKQDLDESNLPGGSQFLLKNKKPIITLAHLMKLYNLENLDVLQCDVDHSEWSVLNSSKEIFQEKKIKHIFLGTHSIKLHDRCKNFLLECGYKLKYEERNMVIGYDSLLIFEA